MNLSYVQTNVQKKIGSPHIFSYYKVFDIPRAGLEEVLIKRLLKFNRIFANPVIMSNVESALRSQPNPKRREENEDKKVVVQRIDAARVCVSVGCLWRRSHPAGPSAD
jgi:hypothetical protein